MEPCCREPSRKGREKRGLKIRGRTKELPERREGMEKRVEREWRSASCQPGKQPAWMMCEWNIISEGGRILRKTLRQIDCHHPVLTEFGGGDCNWKCMELLTRMEKEDH
jgi:hypothetical protein